MPQPQAGEKYRLKEPDWAKTLGQGDPPTEYVHIRDGEEVRIPWGKAVQASAQTTNMADYAPGKVHTDVLEGLADQLEHLPTSD